MTPERVQWSAADYAQVIADHLPTGSAWPRDADSQLMAWVAGNAEIWGDVSARAALLVEMESDPRFTLAMLPEWERAFGLPDPCLAEPQTITDRRNALLLKMTTEGGQSRAFFKSVAAALGYTVTIREYSPFMAGISRAGDNRPRAPLDPTDVFQPWTVGPAENRFYWTVYLLGTKTRWFRAGSGRAGIDPHVRIGLATDLECLFRRWKPAHTEIVFSYAFAATSYDTYAWFRAGQSHAGIDPMLTITEHGGIVDT